MKDKFVKIMFDYGASPFWTKEGGNAYDDFVPISKELFDKLEVWLAATGKALWPYDSGDCDEKPDLVSVSEMGRELAKEVKRECPEWTVFYYDEHAASQYRPEFRLNREKFCYEIHLEHDSAE